ncbi:MAG: 30S ribosomal protein S9 [Candidatus Paceibacterota bacterium]
MVTAKSTTKKAKTIVKTDKSAKVKAQKKAEEAVEKKVDTEEETTEQAVSAGAEKYYEAVGRRKESTVRVRVYTKKSTDNQESEEMALIVVNGKPYHEYFPSPRLRNTVDSPLRKLKSMNRFKATVHAKGGGKTGQADAIRFGLSRALVLFDENFAKKLKKSGYLTRDAREKERRKYGLKKARKAPQWAKR